MINMHSVKAGVRQLLVERKGYTRIIEAIVFASVVPLAGMALFANDPLGIKSGYPWAAALPILFAARYGSKWGIACSLLASVVFLMSSGVYTGFAASLAALCVGTIVMSILVGDAATAWRTRSSRAEAENQYLRLRLKEFSNDYHVLKVSHGQLEEYMAGQRLSLRQALQQAKPLLSTDADGMQAGSELMAIFAQFCSVQVAGIYTMKAQLEVDIKAVATHGNMGNLPEYDPLLRLALIERKLVSVKLESQATDKHEGGLLAVVPIIDSRDHIYGVLAIRDMHFMAFQQENLNILALLGGYVGDMLTRSRGVGQSQASWFLAELDTVVRFAHSHEVQSSLLCLQFDIDDAADQVSKWVSTNIRSLDSAWLPQTKHGHIAVAILLPLIGENDCKAYLRRLGDSVRNEFSLELQDLLHDVQTMQIEQDDTRESCLSFVNKSTGFDQTTTSPDKLSRQRIKRVA